MVGQTHYETLGVDENSSADMITFAYKNKLKDAKEKLQDSPLYFEKEQNLKHAYQVLSNPALRNSYNNKITQERVAASRSSTRGNSSDAADVISGLVFSKGFLASVVVIIVLLVIIPSGEERIAGDVIHKSLDNNHDINNQKMGLENRREDRYMSNQEYIEERGMREQERLETADEYDYTLDERRIDLQEQREESRLAREEARMAREERRLAIQLERETRNAEYEARRMEERERKAEQYEKRQKELEAKRRSQEFIERTRRTSELQKDVNRLKSGY